MPSVLMAGAGAIGLWLAARLAPHADVTVLARPPVVAAVQRDGIRVRDAQGVEADPVRGVAATHDAALLPREAFGACVVTCKAHQTAAVAAAVAPALAPGAPFVSLQNGFGNGAKLAAVRDSGIVVATTSHGVSVEAPGVVRHAGSGPTRIGPHREEGDEVRAAAVLLAAAGLAPEVHRDMRPHVWQKAAVNHAVNPTAAVAGVPNGALLEGPLRAQAATLLEEAYALSRAAGVGVPGGRAGMEEALWGTLERTRANRCSMLQDVAARRPTEAEQITGRLVRLGRRLGHPMFASEDAYHRAKGLEASYLGEERALALTRDEVAWEHVEWP